MSESLERFLDRAGQVAGATAKAATEAAGRGRDKAEQLALQARMAKMERQLGALVYALRKNDEENEAMVGWYVSEIDRLQAKIADLNTPKRRSGGVHVAKPAAEEPEGAMFRDGAGDELAED